jgi:hypothetical protein
MESVADDTELDDNDSGRVEYVIEDPLDDDEARPPQRWGTLVTFYKVDDGDRKVVLLSIHLVEAA